MTALLSPEDLNLSKRALQRVFDDDALARAVNLDELRELLSSRIVYMLHHQMETLLAILYRIDVNEKKVKEAFAQNDPKKIAPIITELVIQRELQKIASRNRYK